MFKSTAACVWICLSATWPPSGFASDSPPKVPLANHRPATPLPIAEQRYFELGSRAKINNSKGRSSLIRFETDLRIIYSSLSGQLGSIDTSTTGGFFSRLTSKRGVRDSAVKLRTAELRLLQDYGVDSSEATNIVSTIFETSGELSVRSSNLFRHFLRGAYSNADGYVNFGNDSVVVGSASESLTFRFPSICIATSPGSKRSVVPTLVSDYLEVASRRVDIAMLFNFTVSHFNERIVRDAQSFSLRGIKAGCGVYGEVIRLGSNAEVNLFPDAIMNSRDVLGAPVFGKAYFDETRVHEIMHYLRKPGCDDSKGEGGLMILGTRYRTKEVEEALASTSSVAAFAHGRSKYLPILLLRNLNQTAHPDYVLVFDLFYRNLFRALVLRQVAAINASQAPVRDPLPRYFESATTVDLKKKDGHSFIPVSVNYPKEGTSYVVRLDRAIFSTQYRLLDSATTEDVVIAADESLRTIAISLRQCKLGKH